MKVAPPAGAWIETMQMELAIPLRDVAPPAGAWIETSPCLATDFYYPRRAPRGRVD